jgi:hypothetical protein
MCYVRILSVKGGFATDKRKNLKNIPRMPMDGQLFGSFPCVELG